MNQQTPEQLKANTWALNPLIWVMDNQFINENQEPIEFIAHRFMARPYSDCHPDQVTMKSAQVGWSVLEILRSIHAAKLLRLNVIYILPTRNASAEFVVPKVNPMLKRNPGLAKLVQNTDNKSLKQVGDRFIYFKGAHHEGEAISTSADLLASDEFDRCNQAVLMAYQSRLQASKYGWNRRFSNPSLPGFGVHELYQDSDQMHWLITCRECGHERWLDLQSDKYTLNHYINEGRTISPTPYYACGKCHKPLSDAARQSGRWYAKYPGRERRGYWVNQLMVPWVSAEKIIKQQKEMSVEVFHNFVLGLPYQASEYLINRQAILRACLPGNANKTEVVIGCDSGKTKHWVIGNPEGVWSYGKTDNWGDIEQMIRLYNATCVIDALPDFTIPEQLARKYPGKVYVHYYSPDNSSSIEVTRQKEGTEFGVIQSDRTKLFDALAADITNGTIRFFQTPSTLDELIYHFENIYRIVEEDTRGIPKARWAKKENKPDHFAHAMAYYRVGLSLMLRSDEIGGVRPRRPMQTTGIYVNPETQSVKVKDALGMELSELVDRSVAKHKRRRG